MANVNLSLDRIPELRRPNPLLTPQSDEAMSHDGAVEITARVAPAPGGAAVIRLGIARPANVTGPTPALYNIHGGGMVMGDSRTGLALVIDWAGQVEGAVIS